MDLGHVWELLEKLSDKSTNYEDMNFIIHKYQSDILEDESLKGTITIENFKGSLELSE